MSGGRKPVSRCKYIVSTQSRSNTAVEALSHSLLSCLMWDVRHTRRGRQVIQDYSADMSFPCTRYSCSNVFCVKHRVQPRLSAPNSSLAPINGSPWTGIDDEIMSFRCLVNAVPFYPRQPHFYRSPELFSNKASRWWMGFLIVLKSLQQANTDGHIQPQVVRRMPVGGVVQLREILIFTPRELKTYFHSGDNSDAITLHFVLSDSLKPFNATKGSDKGKDNF